MYVILISARQIWNADISLVQVFQLTADEEQIRQSDLLGDDVAPILSDRPDVIQHLAWFWQKQRRHDSGIIRISIKLVRVELVIEYFVDEVAAVDVNGRHRRASLHDDRGIDLLLGQILDEAHSGFHLPEN